jgi:hypothetical protein
MLRDIKLAYFNGCSFTQGGGLETENDVDWNERDSNDNEPPLTDGRRDVLKKYKEKYGIPYWKTRLDMAYPAVFSEMTGIKTVNDSKSGGGIERLIRKTFRFVSDNWETRKDMIVFLEVPDYSRLEFYSKKYKDYLLFNYTIGNDNDIEDWFVCRDYAFRTHNDDNNYLRNSFLGIKDSILEPKSIIQSLNLKLLNFLSFLKLNGVRFYITRDLDYNLIQFPQPMFTEHLVPFGAPYEYAQKVNGCIKDEIDIEDVHPGVFGHQKYAKEIVQFLEVDLSYSHIIQPI